MSQFAASKALLGMYLKRHGFARIILWTSTGLVVAIWLAAWGIYQGALNRAEGTITSLGGDEVRFLSPKPLSLFGLDLASFGRDPFGVDIILDIEKTFPGKVSLVQVPQSDVQVRAELFGQDLRSEIALLVLPDHMLPKTETASDLPRFFLPRTLVDLFNQAYAPSKGLPGLDDKALANARYQLSINHQWHDAQFGSIVEGLPLPAPAMSHGDWMLLAPDTPLKTVLMRVDIGKNPENLSILQSKANKYAMKLVDPAEERARVRELFSPLIQGASLLMILLLIAQAGAMFLLWRQDIQQEKNHMQLLKALGMTQTKLVALGFLEGLFWGLVFALVAFGGQTLLAKLLEQRVPLLSGMNHFSSFEMVRTLGLLLLLPATLELLRALLASRSVGRITL